MKRCLSSLSASRRDLAAKLQSLADGEGNIRAPVLKELCLSLSANLDGERVSRFLVEAVGASSNGIETIPLESFLNALFSPNEISAKEEKDLLGTTARKTLVVQLGDMAACVVHAKEPKTMAAARMLARYFDAIGQAACSQSGVKSWVLMSDTNLDGVQVGSAFAEYLSGGRGHAVVPSPTALTTSKHRSYLHGQCYNKKKCKTTVRASKDRLVSAANWLQSPAIYPDLSSPTMTLPRADWAADHCLLTAVFKAP
eukprot:TRINITY_DN32217_c1_g1_i2.p1 TRINITY_DN32217_c1_g1~~TRINITY_DN32217_c1_g1_i2.p1  ORF type:complete len:255 (+),score=40.67 TRINITY_DN32217_c1_g1_i2:269-1033(+)